MADDVFVTITADSSQLEADLARAKAQVGLFAAEVRTAAQEQAKAGASADSELGQRVLAAAAKYAEAKNHVGELSSKLRETKQAGETGSEGLNRFKEVAESIVSTVNNLSVAGAIEKFGASLGGLGVLGAVGATAAVVAAGAIELGKATAEDVVALDDLSKAAGGTIKDMVVLQGAFAKAGESPEVLENAIRRFAITAAEEMPQIARAVRDSAADQEKDLLKVADAARTAAAAQEDIRKSQLAAEDAASNLAAKQEEVKKAFLGVQEAALAVQRAQDAVRESGEGVKSAEISLEEAKYQQGLAYGGSRDKDLERQFKQERADEAVTAAQERLHQAQLAHTEAPLRLEAAEIGLRDARRHEEQAPREVERAQLALIDAQRAEVGAIDKAREAALNFAAAVNAAKDNLNKNVPAVAQALFGERNDINLKEVSPAVQAQALLSRTGPNFFDAFAGLNEVFNKTVTDSTGRFGLGGKLFGPRSIDQGLINTITSFTPERRKDLEEEYAGRAKTLESAVPTERKALSKFEEAGEAARYYRDVAGTTLTSLVLGNESAATVPGHVSPTVFTSEQQRRYVEQFGPRAAAFYTGQFPPPPSQNIANIAANAVRKDSGDGPNLGHYTLELRTPGGDAKGKFVTEDDLVQILNRQSVRQQNLGGSNNPDWYR